MARLPELREVADHFSLKLGSIKDLIQYRLKKEIQITRKIDLELPTEHGNFQLYAYQQVESGEIHLALVKGILSKDEAVLVRVHASCVTGDVFGSCLCNCGSQLHSAMAIVEKDGKGVVLYMKSSGRETGLLAKLKSYKLPQQEPGAKDPNLNLGFEMDERDYGIGAQILRDLGISKMRIITNSRKRRVGLVGYGLEVVEYVKM